MCLMACEVDCGVHRLQMIDVLMVNRQNHMTIVPSFVVCGFSVR